MKVFLCDAVQGKTTKHFEKWLRENHEVVTDMYFNPVYAEWADIIYIEWCESPAIEASKLKGHYDGVYDHEGVWGEKNQQYTKDFDWTGTPIYIRAIDMDVWYGHYHSVTWENVTGLLYIAKHIYDLMLVNHTFPPALKIAHVPLSVNLDDWTFAVRDSQRARNIACVGHNWSAKGIPLLIQGLYELVELTQDKTWKLHIVSNGRSNEYWLFDYVEHMIEVFGLKDNVTFYESVPDVNEFLDDKDYLVSSSFKEAFSLILAEGAAKGMKILTHSWRGADDIWPEKIIWKTPHQFALKMIGMWNSNDYREIAATYSHDIEINKLKEVMGL